MSPGPEETRPPLYFGAPVKTGKERRVKVPHSKDLASHVVPESCASHREVRREALTGVRTGQPLSRDRRIVPGADAVEVAQGNTGGRAKRKCPPDSARSKTLACAHAPCAGTGRSPVRPPMPVRIGGPHREGEEPKPMMHGLEKSDPVVVATKPANKAGPPAAERVEPRAAD
jgi:hypothetical protein